MASTKRIAATLVATGTLLAGGAAVANAATNSPSAPPTTTPGSTQCGPGHHGPRGTAVTGSELTKVTHAVKAKEGSVTIDHVFQDKKGDYHVAATKAGKRVFYDVSSDLKTITRHTFDGRWRNGRGTAVTGSELTRVTHAVKAKEGSVIIDHVFQDKKGDYHVAATKAGKRVFYDVSSDLKTITRHTFDGRSRGGHERPGAMPGSAPSASAQQS